MPESIETAVESTSRDLAIKLDSPVGIAVTALALYGAKALTSDVRRGVSKIRENRKAKKAEKDEQPRRSEA